MTVYLVYQQFRKAILCPKCGRANKMHMNKDGSLHCGYCSVKFRISSKTKLRKLEELSDIDLNWEIKTLQKLLRGEEGAEAMRSEVYCPYPTCNEKLRHIGIYGNPKFVVGWCVVHNWVFTERKRGEEG